MRRVGFVLLSATFVSAGCHFDMGDSPPVNCDALSYNSVWANLDLTLWLDFIEDCPWSGVSEGDTLIIAGAVEDNTFSYPNFATTTGADMFVNAKLDEESCLTAFWGEEQAWVYEQFWQTGTPPNTKWIANLQLQYPAQQGHDSGDCMAFYVYDSSEGTAHAFAEIVYN